MDAEQLSKAELVKQLIEARAEKERLLQQLQIAGGAGARVAQPSSSDSQKSRSREGCQENTERSGCGGGGGGGSGHGSGEMVAGANPAPPSAAPYEVSLSVMVIEHGIPVAMPLSTVLGKQYGNGSRAFDWAYEREADTPVVGANSMMEPFEGCCSVSRMSSVGRPSIGDARVSEMIRRAASCNRPSIGSLGSPLEGRKDADDDMYDDELFIESTDAGSSTTKHHSAGRHERVSGEMAVSGEAQHDPAGGDDEPMPVKPLQLQLLALQAGVRSANRKSMSLRSTDSSVFARGFSLDTEALISHNTLRRFHRQFRGGLSSPVSSYASAVYHYIIKTFAVANGCEHRDADLEGFGRTLCSLCVEVERVLQAEPRHLSIASPCYVFGDLHGNFRDLFYFMDNLMPFQDLRYTPHRFLFLGDYVDRGEYSVEVIAYLFALKVLAPEKVLLLRGNHEDTLVSGDLRGYGSTSFRAQCRTLFGTALGEELWNKASQTFSHLPFTANIDGKIFCTHGGIPRHLHYDIPPLHKRSGKRGKASHGGDDDYDDDATIDSLDTSLTLSSRAESPEPPASNDDNRMEMLSREDFPPMLSLFQAPANESASHKMFRQMATDVCWADPAEDETHLDKNGFGANPRGSGVIIFGSTAVDVFLRRYNFQYIFRAHQEKSNGLKMSKNARVFTVFSTSAYVGHRNGAGVVLVADGKIRLIIKHADDDEETEDVTPPREAPGRAEVEDEDVDEEEEESRVRIRHRASSDEEADKKNRTEDEAGGGDGLGGAYCDPYAALDNAQHRQEIDEHSNETE